MVVMIILCMVDLHLTDHKRMEQLVHSSTSQDCHRPVECQGFILHLPAFQPRAGQTTETKTVVPPRSEPRYRQCSPLSLSATRRKKSATSCNHGCPKAAARRLLDASFYFRLLQSRVIECKGIRFQALHSRSSMD